MTALVEFPKPPGRARVSCRRSACSWLAQDKKCTRNKEIRGRRTQTPHERHSSRRSPLVVSRERDNATAALKRIAKEGLGLDCLRAGVECRHAQLLERLAPPPRHKSPARIGASWRFPSSAVTTSTGSVGQTLSRG